MVLHTFITKSCTVWGRTKEHRPPKKLFYVPSNIYIIYTSIICTYIYFVYVIHCRVLLKYAHINDINIL